MKDKSASSSDHIVQINMYGMRGRMLHLTAPKNKKRDILLLYGHHASIERMIGLAEELNKYGSITLPDFPGFGGMDSFYSIGEKPTLDNMADYLAAFVKMRFKRRRLTIAGMSFGFVVATRMLQRNPELAKRVDMLVSIVGFAHHEDFRISRRNYLLMRYGASLLSRPVPAFLAQHLALRAPFIRLAYGLVADRHVKLRDANEVERKRRIDFEIMLWQINDIRTYMDNAVTMSTLDLCKAQVDLPVWHVSVEPDRYFDNSIVEQHLNVIYKKVTVVPSKIQGHAPTVVATAREAAPFIPSRLRRVLSRQ